MIVYAGIEGGAGGGEPGEAGGPARGHPQGRRIHRTGTRRYTYQPVAFS